MIHGDAPYDSGFLIFQEPPMPNANAQCQRPMPYAQCPMPHALCPMPAIFHKS
ncbi:MAG: hypothetical protein WBL95_10910 [Microcoleus sp.]